MMRILICAIVLAGLLAAPAAAQWEYSAADVADLVELLSSDQAVLRQLAATGLGLADPFFASLGVPALRDQLADEDEQARLAAAWALGRLGDVGADGLPAALVNEDPRVLVAAAEGLAQSGLPAAEVIAAGFGYVGQKPVEDYDEADQQAITAAVDIARHVWDSDLEPVAAMLEAVSGIEDSEASMYEIQLLEAMAEAIAREKDYAVPILLDALDSDNPTVRGVSVLALGDLAPDSRVFLPRMIDLLGDDSYYVRRMSAYAIARLGPAAADAIPYLIDNIPEPEDWRNDWPVTGALADIGAAAVPALLELLGDQDDEDRRYIAAHALEMMGPPGRESLPELFAVMASDTKLVSEQAGRAVAAIAVYDPDTLSRLIEMLESSTPQGRTAAAIALGALRPPATAAVPALARAVSDKDQAVRENAIFALQDLGPRDEASIDALVAALADEQVNRLAANALYRIGAATVPALSNALADDNATVRYTAAGVLNSLGPLAAKAIPALITCLDDTDPLVSKRAAQSIGSIRALPEIAVPALLAACDGGNYATALEAIQSLGYYGEAAQDAVPRLAEMADSEDMFIQESAIVALGRIGPAAGGALEALQALLADPDIAPLAQRSIDAIQGNLEPVPAD